MPTKGKQISVIIAGATGSTGRYLVSRLVSHPDVSRVVALARYPIPVNRWTSVFPHLHSGDALRYLSVVPIDWAKVLADSANIPSSYVSDGVWRQDEEAAERLRFLNYMTHAAAREVFRDGGAVEKSIGTMGGGSDFAGMGPYQNRPSASHLHGEAAETTTAGPSSDMWSSVTTVESAVGVRPVGYVKFTPRRSVGAYRERADQSKDDGSAAGASAFLDAEKLQDSQAFLQQLLHNSFYNSVFSGHTVAINCLGTSHVLSSGSVVLVDYELSIAFAKIMRLFNCMAHAEPTDDEERLLVEMTSRELDNVLWGEIFAACYGKQPEAAGREASPPVPPGDGGDAKEGEGESGKDRPASAASLWPAHDATRAEMERMSRDSTATLKHYSQMSVRGANVRSPIPYLRAHGQRDRDILRLFHRVTRTLASPGILHSLFLTTPMTHTVVMGGAEQAAAAKVRSDDPHAANEVLSTTTGSVRFGASPTRVMKERAWREQRDRQAAAKASAEGGSEPHRGSGLLRQVWRSVQVMGRGAMHDSADTEITVPEADKHYYYDAPALHVEESPDAVARRRAQLLLRRDVVKIWEDTSITIWRPGVFVRPKPRFLEWVFSFFERPIDVRILAECMVDDIMESVCKEGNPGNFGSVKIINGKSVARRTAMKLIEDGLNVEDTKGRMAP